MQGRIKNARRNESQKQKIPKFLKLGRRLQEPCYKFPDLLSYCINYGIAVALANLFATYGVGYIIAVTIANFVIADGIGYVVAVAITYFVAPDGIDYGVAVTLADVVATDGVNYIVAITSADAQVGGRSSSGSNVGRLAGAEAQQGEKYVQKFLHFLMYHCRDVNIMIKNKTWRVAMLHIVDDFTVFYVREYLAFLFLRERQSIPTIIKTA